MTSLIQTFAGLLEADRRGTEQPATSRISLPTATLAPTPTSRISVPTQTTTRRIVPTQTTTSLDTRTLFTAPSVPQLVPPVPPRTQMPSLAPTTTSAQPPMTIQPQAPSPTTTQAASTSAPSSSAPSSSGGGFNVKPIAPELVKALPAPPAPKKSWLVPALIVGGGILVLWLASTADSKQTKLAGTGEPDRGKKGLKDPLAYLDDEFGKIEEDLDGG